jgi:hypothetical protein
LAAFQPDTTLVYGDMDVVAPDGSRAASTYWTTRRNNYTDLASLIFANTVTGAASVFRVSLLADVLPFPPRIGDAYHDHWIACVALTRGALGYVDAPLQAYRQHAGNVLGHHVPPPHRMLPTVAEARRALGRAGLGRRLMAELWRRREVYVHDVVRLIVLAKTLRLRLGAATTVAKRAVLDRVAGLEAAPLGLVRESVVAVLEKRPTLGAEWHCLRGTLAARALDVHYRRNRQRLFDERVVRHEITGGGGMTGVTAGVDLIEQKLAPLRVRVEPAAPMRVNLIAPAIDFAHLFAGYVGKLQLALRLTDSGHRVRIVIVDPCDHDAAAWRRDIARYPGLEDLFDRVEVLYAADRERPVEMSPADAFVATTWWTAHIADRAAHAVGRRPFVYLIQEFEPMTFPMGSLHALADASYTFPHRALFSTGFLHDYFRNQRVGVHADVPWGGPKSALTFENAIASFDVTTERLARSRPHRLLVYARPEQHAARNMFELGILALRAAVADGALSPAEWLIDGIGAGRAFEPVSLGRGVRLALLPRVSLAEYYQLLPRYDAGLSLMLTPHPSLVPLEMAAAGLVTVTNTYANKTAAALGCAVGEPGGRRSHGRGNQCRDSRGGAADAGSRSAGRRRVRPVEPGLADQLRRRAPPPHGRVVDRLTTPMRVAMDLTCLKAPMGGYERYASRLLEALVALPGSHRMVAFTERGYGPRLVPAGAELHAVATLPRFLLKVFLQDQTYWPWLMRRARVDVVHTPIFAGMVAAPRPYVLTLHDLIPLQTPEAVSRTAAAYWQLVLPLAVRRADAIITGSDFTRAGDPRAFRNRARARRHRSAWRRAALRARGRCHVAGGGSRSSSAAGALSPLRRHREPTQEPRPLGPSVRCCWPTGIAATPTSSSPAARMEERGPRGRYRIEPWPPASAISASCRMTTCRRCTTLARAGGESVGTRGVRPPALEALACGHPPRLRRSHELSRVVGDAALLVDPDDESAVQRALAAVLAVVPR